MVPVFRTEDPAEIARAVASLDAAGIPSLRVDDRQPAGLMIGPVPPGTSVIVVPQGFLQQARMTLRQTRLNVVPPRASPPALEAGTGTRSGTPSLPSVAPQRASIEVRPTESVRSSLLTPAEDDDEILETPPYESMSAQGRFTVALGACAIGALLQAVLLVNGGFDTVRRVLALSWDGHAFQGNVVTAGLVHGSSLHFLGNLAFGLLLGFVLLGTHGVGATAMVWLTASMLGIAAEAYLSPGAVVLGASAGIYGLVGLWLRGNFSGLASRCCLGGRSCGRRGLFFCWRPARSRPLRVPGVRSPCWPTLSGSPWGCCPGRYFRGGWANRIAWRTAAAAGGRWAFLRP